MKLKHLLILAVTVAVVVIAWKVTDHKAPQTEVLRANLFPNLLERLNEVSKLTLRSGDSHTSLLREGESWLIENKDNFSADGGNVRRTLLQLAELRTIEAKTDNPERYARLGVENADHAEAAGTLVEVRDADDSAIVSLIVGNQRSNAAREQHYVRRSGEAQTWLVEGPLEVATDPIRWLDAQVVDIDTARVREVRITPADGPAVIVTKAERDDNFFELQNVPEGFEAKSKATVSSMGAVLLDLRFNDVASAERIATLDPVRHIELETFDGLLVTMDEFELDEQPFMRFGFEFDAARVVAAPEADVPEADGENPEPTADEPAAESVADEAARLKQHTAKWVYALPNYKQRMINREFDDLIKAVEKNAPDPE